VLGGKRIAERHPLTLLAVHDQELGWQAL